MGTEVNSQAVAMRVSAVSIIGNLILAFGKLIAGFAAHSNAMIGDAVHSASDIFSTIVVMVGVKLASKESDAEHPYGHERLECVAAILLSAVLFATGLAIAKESVASILAPKAGEVPGVLALIAAAISILAKEGMFRYTAYNARKIRSGALMADAWHHRSDALSSIGALIGIAGARLGFLWMDGAAGIVIFGFIAKAAYDIFMDAVQKMVDHACDSDTEAAILQVALDNPQVISVDLLQTREFGSKVYVDMEIGVDGRLSLTDAHAIAETVHSEIEQKFPQVKHIMVHVNPKKV